MINQYLSNMHAFQFDDLAQSDDVTQFYDVTQFDDGMQLDDGDAQVKDYYKFVL